MLDQFFVEVLVMDENRELRFNRIALLPDKPGFRFSLTGKAKSIQTGSNGSFTDHRVTFADRFFNESEVP